MNIQTFKACYDRESNPIGRLFGSRYRVRTYDQSLIETLLYQLS
ncbi:hypothetical protein BRC2024_KCUCJSVR_CDS_0170 [Acinetobacter phage vB_AbaM_KissB]